MSRTVLWAAVAVLVGGATACDSGPRAATGFRLPAYGNVDNGKSAFMALECNRCHRVSGVEMPHPKAEGAMTVVLGGDTPRQMTDGYLVTSIINPSHIVARHPKELMTSTDGKSRMPDYSDMTVRQMTDLVAFLQAHYKVRPPAREYAASY
jgi:hypothetical protein